MTRRLAGGRLVAATHNAGKLAEIRELLAAWPVEVVSARALGLDEPAETEATFVGNARIKAHAAAASGLPALADDSGIEVDALGGAPGVHTADWAELPGGGRDFHRAMRRTWAELEETGAPTPRTARFRCTLVLAWPDGHDEVFEGAVEGQCVWPMRGAEGHGYDPMFLPDGHELTFGQMDPAAKNRISHRARAFERLIAGCFA